MRCANMSSSINENYISIEDAALFLTVKRALADLEQHGYLAKLPRYRPNGSNTSDLYTIK